MPDLYLIRIANSAAGLASRVPEGFRFHSSTARFDTLDGKLFKGPAEAAAVVRMLYGRRSPTSIPRDEDLAHAVDSQSR